MPDSHLILVAGKHSLTEESITPRMEGYRLPKDSDDCRDKKRGCKVYYGEYLYSESDERLSTLERIEGRLVIRNTILTNLSKFEKITIVGLYGPALVITDNSHLKDISSLYKMKIRGPEPVLIWQDNGAHWCHNKADLKLLSRITQKKPYKLGTLNYYGSTRVDDRFLNSTRHYCRCGCFVFGSLEIRDLDGETVDLTPLKNVYAIYGTLTITGNTRLYDLSFLENLNSIGNYSANITVMAFELNRNVDLFDAYMENLVRIHGEVQVQTCWKLPERTEKLFRTLTQNKAAIWLHETEHCTRELHEKEEKRIQIVDQRFWNMSFSENTCHASNNDELKVVLQDQSIRRLRNAQGHNLTLCEHFYGYMKLHASESEYGEVGFIQHLKTITGCLDIVNVTTSRTGKIGNSQFEELDLTNLAKIDYDDALCGDIFALRIMRNKFLRRIDFNENLTLNGGYFIRMNSAEGKIYFDGNPNTTFLWSDPKDCMLEDPEKLVKNCTNLIGPVFLESQLEKPNALFDSKQIKRIYGQLIIRSTKYNDLDAYGYLTIIADNKDAVIIENNKNLRDITALTKMNITLSDKFPKEASENWKPVVVRNNGKICLKSRRNDEDVRKIVSSPLQFSDFCRLRCVGGIVTDLTSLQSCRIVMGGLTIKDYDFESASDLLRYFEEIEDIEGQLIIMNNTGIKNLAFLKSLLRVSDYTTKRPIFRVADNPNLTSIEPLHKVELEYSPYEVHLVAVIETYSKISDHEQKELGIQGKVEFRVKERLHPTKGRRSKRKRDRKENADNLGVGIALSVGGCLIITIFGYGYSFFAYLREQRELKRRQQPEGGQAAPVGRAP